MPSQLKQSLRDAVRLVRVGAENRDGVAIVEFALVASFLVALMLPIIDIGMGFYYKTRVMTAAQAGAQYAFVHDWSGNSATTETAITTAVTSAMDLSVSATPAPSLSCKCADGTRLNDPANPPSSPFTPSTCASLAATNCTGSNNPNGPGAYVTVNAQVTYNPLFVYLGFGNPVTLSASSTVRVQ
jgi:Flp pilus assembly protein TadG